MSVRTGSQGVRGGTEPKAKSNKAGGISDEMPKAASDPTLTFTQTEKAFMAQVIQYATLRGWVAWHDRANNAPRACKRCKARLDIPRNDPGFPDLILVRRPRVVWAELKAERGRLSTDQRDWLRELAAAGQEVFVWRPSDFEEIQRVLK